MSDDGSGLPAGLCSQSKTLSAIQYSIVGHASILIQPPGTIHLLVPGANWASGSGQPASFRITGSPTLMSGRRRSCGFSGFRAWLSRPQGTPGRPCRRSGLRHRPRRRTTGLIRSMVRGSPLHDDGTGNKTVSPMNGTPVDQQILGELKSIRTLLEKR